MGTSIKLITKGKDKGKYKVWSSTVDAFVTNAGTLEEIFQYFMAEDIRKAYYNTILFMKNEQIEMKDETWDQMLVMLKDKGLVQKADEMAKMLYQYIQDNKLCPITFKEAPH